MSYLIFLPVVVSVIFLVILAVLYLRDYSRLKKERSEERGEDPIGNLYHQKAISAWVDWRRWTFSRYYHKIRNFILIRTLSANTTILKGVFGVGLALGAYSVAEKSAVVAGATVFYATLLFIESRYSYAALWPVDIDMRRYGIEDEMDNVSGTLEIVNIGEDSARDIQTQMHVIDPVRQVKTSLLEDDISTDDTNISEPLESGLSRKFRYTLDDGEFYRTKLKDRLGISPWAVIDLRTPDALTVTRVYVPLPESERILLRDIAEGAEGIAKAWKLELDRLGIDTGSIELVERDSDEPE